MSDSSTVLVLGASGGIGGEMARLLLARGWRVRAMKRGLGVARREQGGIEWVEGDALQAADVMAAAQGCSVIVHAVNPPGYRRWAEWVLPMIDNTIAAAQATAPPTHFPRLAIGHSRPMGAMRASATPVHGTNRRWHHWHPHGKWRSRRLQVPDGGLATHSQLAGVI